MGDGLVWTKKDQKVYTAAWYIRHRDEVKIRARLWKKSNPEQRRATQKAWENANPGKLSKNYAKWKKANPEKVRAQQMANNAKIPMVKCSRCGSRKKPLHKHHADYSKPLEVLVLCSKCHGKEHVRLKKLKKKMEG